MPTGQADERGTHTLARAECGQRPVGQISLGGERLGLGRQQLGALLIGYYDAQKHLRYAGKVGTGFSRETLLELRRRLDSLETTRNPFYDRVNPRGGTVHWVKPKLVAQVSFTQWTRDGRLRHPRFLGVRRDKDPREVVRERPA